MKITDETKEFTSKHRVGKDRLRVASNHYGEHEKPSLFLGVWDPFTDTDATFGTEDTDQIKEIIEHMAKMAGLEVKITERFEPKYQPGDRVLSIHRDCPGVTGTVLHDKYDLNGWNVRVQLDGGAGTGRFMYNELEPVTKNV